MNGDWTGAREFFSFSLKSVSLNPLWCRSSNFSRNSVSFRNFTKFQNSRFPGSAIAAQDLAMNQSSAGEKNCIVYSLVFIFIVIIISNSCISSITMSMSISISFVALLNCLYLNPWFSSVVHFSSPSCWGWGGEGWASGCLVLSCQLLAETTALYFVHLVVKPQPHFSFQQAREQ